MECHAFLFFLSNFDLNEFSKADGYYCPAPKNINKLGGKIFVQKPAPTAQWTTHQAQVSRGKLKIEKTPHFLIKEVKCHLKSQQTYLFMLQKKNYRLLPSEKIHQAVGDISIRKHPIALNPGNSVSQVLGVSKKDVPFEFNARSLPMTVVPGDS